MIERSLRLLALFVGAALWLCAGPNAHAQAAQQGRIPVKLVAGRLVARCDVSTEVRRIPVNLFVEYDNPCGLELHNRAADPLKTELPDGSQRTITIHFQGGEMFVPGRELGDEDELEAFTKWYSTELGDNAVVGTIGAAVLANYHLVFDLGAGAIEYGPPLARSAEHVVAPSGGASVPVSIKNEMVWLPVLLDDGVPRTMALGTSRYDTIVDEDFCELRGHPAGDIGSARIGDCDLSDYVALRPAPVPFTHRDGALGVLGSGLLQKLRVEVDRANRWVTITPVAEPELPVADRAFFEALVSEDSEQVLAYLDAYPESRCAAEAADLLLDQLVAEGFEDEQLDDALTWIDRTCQPDLRATAALERMKELLGLGLTAAAVRAGELGVEGGRDDRYPDAVHQLHAQLGTILLDAGESREAWKHLLSAAFGLPEDGMVNLQLGRFYEQEGRYRRAFSRYVQAVIQPESSPRAMEGLVRLQAVMNPDEALSIDLIERLIAGKVEGFGAATKYEFTPETDTNRVVLIEHLTNAHEEFANGGALALEGVLDHFERDNVAVISFHMSTPQPDPLHNAAARRADLLHDAQESVFVVNGRARVPGRARTRQKEEVYGALRSAVIAELRRPSDYELQVDAHVKDGVVSGEVVVEGPEAAGIKLELWLVERGVLFPGKSKVVIHRMVVRDALLDSVRGETLAIGADGKMTRSFSRSLADVRSANEAYLLQRQAEKSELIELVSTAIDPGQVSVVAVLRRSFTGEVMQARYVEAPREDAE
ncbi:MAG: hypothetical protein H6831_14150 [Planctomycetes bacterium]|nr:hypothetical protein [Planctomycetota bacterium]MCB9905543.1 hypothetical protein [Planctomycetota bacterium]